MQSLPVSFKLLLVTALLALVGGGKWAYIASVRATSAPASFTTTLYPNPTAGGLRSVGQGSPTLGNYPNTTVITGGNTTVTPDAAPVNAVSMTAATSTNFKGTLAVNPANGVVGVTNAHVAGSYAVTVTAFGSSGMATKTFTLTVNNPANCPYSNFVFNQATDSPVSVGNNPLFAAVGDLNGDGKQDLAVTAGSSPGNLTILLGNGSGGFSSALGSPIGVGDNPQSVVVGDFNGDSKRDLAVAGSNSNIITILLGSGDGGFSPATGSPISLDSPFSMVVGDFNGDSKQDLAVVNLNPSTVTVLLGNGNGGFTPAVGPLASTGSSSFAIALGDFNSDGKQDLVVPNLGSNNLTILLGNGSGGLSPASGSPVGAGSFPAKVAVGDFNSDGNQDLAVTNYDAPGKVTVLLGNGNGGFIPAANSINNVTLGTFSVAVGDAG